MTNPSGAFDVPALDAGLYTVTVSLSNFTIVVLTDVELLSGTARAVKVALEIGALTDSVKVEGGCQLIQTQATTESSTVRVDQISNLPLITRSPRTNAASGLTQTYPHRAQGLRETLRLEPPHQAAAKLLTSLTR